MVIQASKACAKSVGRWVFAMAPLQPFDYLSFTQLHLHGVSVQATGAFYELSMAFLKYKLDFWTVAISVDLRLCGEESNAHSHGVHWS